jgi:photosystem II stability/assembly factor-like uncharacterized protein
LLETFDRLNRRRFPAGPWLPVVLGAILALVFANCGVAQEGAWQPVGPPGGTVISLASASKGVVYLGTADGHVFISRDAGRHWLLRGRVSARHDAVIQKLLLDTRNPEQLLAAAWFQEVREGGGLYRSDDEGATWNPAGLSGEMVRTVEQSASAPEIFVAGARSGIFRSVDSARTWQRISPPGDAELRNVDSLAIDPRDPQIIYAGTYHLPWKTSDGGKTWFPAATGMIDDSDVMSLRIDAANPARIFASACSGIYRSENAAAAWTKLQGIPYSSRRTQEIVQHPGDPRTLYAATTEGLWLTRDGGESWTRSTPRDWIVNAVLAVPDTSASGAKGLLLLGTEVQGVLVSTDGGATFALSNDGFSHRVAAALVRDSRHSQHLLAWLPGAPDPLLETSDGGVQWQALPGRAPAEIVHIFSTEAGWWLASASSGLLRYDADTAKWSGLRFAAARLAVRDPPARALPTSRHAQRKPPLKIPTASDISAILTVGGRAFVATPQALWSGSLGEKILRPQAIATAASELNASDFSREVLWMVAGGRAVRSLDGGKSWTPAALQLPPLDPQAATGDASAAQADIRWVSVLLMPAEKQRPFPERNLEQTAQPMLLVGTAKGLYRGIGDLASGGGVRWQLVQSGLSASEPVAYSFADRLWIVAMRGGGMYISRDASQTWERLDSDALSAAFTGVALVGEDRLVAASLSEGLLRRSAAPASAGQP